jgi:hypothetical protein
MNPRHAMNRSLDGLQNASGRFGVRL